MKVELKFAQKNIVPCQQVGFQFLSSWSCAILFMLCATWAVAAPKSNPDAIEKSCDQTETITGNRSFMRDPPGTDPVLLKPLEARAYWLNGQLAKWPGVDTSGIFKLYYSAEGKMNPYVYYARKDKTAPYVGNKITGSDGALALDVFTGTVPADIATRFKYVADGVVLALKKTDIAKLPGLLKQQLVLVQETSTGEIRQAATLQIAGALDDIYAAAKNIERLGITVGRDTTFKLWAPTARRVSLCLYPTANGEATSLEAMRFDTATGVWSLAKPRDLSGQYYLYVIDVVDVVDFSIRSTTVTPNRVTDPYSISLTADSARSYIANLNAPRLKPHGWDRLAAPNRVAAQTDMAIYELHVRDFSINDQTVSAANRGKYLAFTEAGSNGMKHLAALSSAGMTDVHLLPVFDIATIPEVGCLSSTMPTIPTPAGDADSETQQATATANAAYDCFNWGYDPYHFNAPEGSYASDAVNGAARILEFRSMVMALHRTGLRVGMDVVYNHTTASGQSAKSVLDRIVPGYYHRLNAVGQVEQSTCCANTATENMMMGKLMIDSAVLWATAYKIDSFRFDLMGHQPRAVMEALQTKVNSATGRTVNLIGEGWNFAEVENGARFVQASQLSLNGSGIGTFSDRARDAVRGGGAADSGEALIKAQGYINGLVYDANALANRAQPISDLMRTADLVRVGLAGTIRDYVMTTYQDAKKPLREIDYAGQPAGYASQPGEVVNYVDNHDNQTLFDINVYKLPLGTSREDRARVQMLGAATTAFSQGVAYFHAGIDMLRSKSMDGNSYDSGDWFNRLDFTYRDNYFGTGMPPKRDNEKQYALIKPLLANPAIKPTQQEILWARDAFRDLLKIRASSTLFRLRTTEEIMSRLNFYNTGSTQNPVVIVGHLDGHGYAGAGFKEILYFLNVDKVAQQIVLPGEQNKLYRLHPVHARVEAADQRAATDARYERATGRFTVPARTALVYVVN